MNLTKENITEDIQDYQQRIEEAKSKILALPSATGRSAKKMIGVERNRLLTEIRHIKRLVDHANEALEELSNESVGKSKM
jgi:hypothetical protein